MHYRWVDLRIDTNYLKRKTRHATPTTDNPHPHNQAALLAFRELSRLRARVDCNVIVLDEVLNHLDGPGRARVGRVLRAMCQRPAVAGGGGAEAGGGKGEGEYGGISTAIVILQDLAAGELEVRGGKRMMGMARMVGAGRTDWLTG
jgi:hypothetical protein